MRDCHPTPSRISLRSMRADPAPPGEGKRTRSSREFSQTCENLPRRGAPETLKISRPSVGVGNAGCPGTRSRACSVGSTRVSHHEYPDHPAFPHAMVLTAYIALSPATNSSCHRHRRIWIVQARLGRRASADLAPATGARTTRFCRPRKHRSSARRSAAHGFFANPPCDHITRTTPPRPPHPAPRQ
jgi:hypothetical protein